MGIRGVFRTDVCTYHVHPCVGPHSQQKPGQVPTATHMGPPPPGISYSSAKAHKPSNHILNHLTHPTGSPSSHSPTPPTAHYGGGTYFSLFPMVSTHVCPKYTPCTPNTPSPNLQQVLQQHHLGKFLTFYLLG